MSDSHLHEEPREALESALFEIKRVIIGQDAMLERVMVALLTGGHVLLEGVPGLAKTLTIKTLASVVGGSFSRIQFTPDLVPSDLVGTRVYRPDSGSFDTELGPVFANFLLADEINRAPAKVQSALLEVMQEQQVTIGGGTHLVPLPFLVLATQNPIESEGTYPLPEAQVDRFLMKILVDYPSPGDEASVVNRSLDPPAIVEERLTVADLLRFREAAADVIVDREVIDYAVALADATRRPDRYGLTDVEPLVSYGASPRGPIGLVQSARSLALLRGRRHVLASDIRDLAPEILRHRLVLSYEGLSEGTRPDDLLDKVLEAVPEPDRRPVDGEIAGGVSRRWRERPPRLALRARPPGARVPGPSRRRSSRRSTSPSSGGRAASSRASTARPVSALGPSSRSCGPTSPATTCASSTRPRPRARASRTCASRCPSGCSRPGSRSTCRRRWRSARPTA